MSQTTELARVKARIKALAEKTVANGCTKAEALSAAEMVGRLLEQYALSMDEIDVRTSRAASRLRCRWAGTAVERLQGLAGPRRQARS